MILRKPYGFLIKHFKFIHLVLTVCYAFLAIKVNQVLGYYNAFIQGTVSKLDAISYVTSYYIVFIVLSIIICLIVYWLMRYKDKPRLLYLVLIGFYLVVAVIINVSYQGLNTIYVSVLETKTLRLYRDLLQIMVLFQYLSIMIVLVRGLGFDIKKFNFVQDLEELNIDVSDEEEIELSFGSTDGIKRKAHRRFRELKYYFVENKIFIIIVLAAIFGVGVSSLVVHEEVVAKEYQEGELFSSADFSFNVLNTFVTNRGYDSSTITRTETSFVVVRMRLGTNSEKKNFNTSNLILEIGQNSYSSSKKYGARFKDLGYVYQGEKISGQTTYLFIYNISNGDINKKMKLVYAGDKTVNLSPVYLDDISNKKNYKMGENINLSDTVLGSGYLKINFYSIQESFSYTYQYEVLGQTYDSNMIITSPSNAILNLVIDSEYPYGFDNYFMISNYGALKYKIGEEEYSFNIVMDKTPGSYKDGIYVVVDKNILNASNIWLEFNIRDKQFVYTLK